MKKLQQMEDIIHQKNAIEIQLNQQLKEMKEELQNERQTFASELIERENRERFLESTKEQLEQQLTAVDRENYESLQELSLMQERLQEKMRTELELKEEKNKLLAVIRENNAELEKEKEALEQRLKQQEEVVEVCIVIDHGMLWNCCCV